MKKTLLFLFATLALISCEYANDDPAGFRTVKTFTVFTNDWELVGDPGQPNSYYRYIYKIRDLTQDIYANGVLDGYFIQSAGTFDEVQTPLPFTIPISNQGVYWTETFTFDYQPGSIAFYIRYSDFDTTVRPPTCNFRIVMSW